MRIMLELGFDGSNHLRYFHQYDYMMGGMIRGFQFRVRPIFFVFLWRSK